MKSSQGITVSQQLTTYCFAVLSSTHTHRWQARHEYTQQSRRRQKQNGSVPINKPAELPDSKW